MNLLNLYNANGDQLNIESIGMNGLKLRIPSPSYELETEVVDGGHTIVLDKRLNPRSLVAEFLITAENYRDSLKVRNDLFALIGDSSEIYIEETNVPGKWWKVNVGEWKPERVNQSTMKIDLFLLCLSGISESVSMLPKKFMSSTFTYKNEGNLLIDPSKHSETEITFKGASTNLTISNNTTGDVWKYTGSTVVSDIIKLKGVQAFKNDSSIFGQTNKKLLTIAVGNNDFAVGGATGSFELVISTRFYFL